MKQLFLALTFLISYSSLAQDVEVAKVKPTKANVPDTSNSPSVVFGFGALPSHALYRVIDSTGERVESFTSMPIRFQVNATKLYKGLGFFAAIEFANAKNGNPFMDNSSDPNDVSTWKTRYFRHMLGLNYTFGKFGVYAGMDMFSKNGFFRSVGEGGTIGSGRKTLGVTYNAYKGLTVSLDFSGYAGPAIGVNYAIPLKGLN
jgi:hypothetical protein